jgi:hypothetical protein
MNGIIGGAAAAGPRLIYGDNLYMYGPVGCPIREDLPIRPIWLHSKYRSEHALRRVVCVRGR